MRIAVKPNFFSAEDCASLSAVTLRGVVDGWVSTGIGAGGLGASIVLEESKMAARW